MKKAMRSAVKPVYQMNFSGLRPYAMGHALGMMFLLTMVFYGLFVWFGDYDATFIVAQYPIAFEFNDWTFLFGLVQSYVLAYVFGWVFAKFYNSV
ncbi:MAG: hypothetical protein AABY16_04375 [Nanoarchaeota archaeon]